MTRRTPILTWSRKVALTVAGVITLLATGIGTIPSTQANGSQAPSSAIAALQQRRAQLIAELAAMQPSLSAAGGSVSSAEAAFNAQQTKVLNQRKQLAQLNATLLALSSALNSNDATAAQDKAQLAGITRATYETSGGNQVLAAVLSAGSFNQAIDELKAAGQEVNSLRLGEHMVAKTVCRHAVKANDPLAGRELENLVEDLRRCAMPYTCPHGRPTLIEMNFRELEKKFGRTV